MTDEERIDGTTYAELDGSGNLILKNLDEATITKIIAALDLSGDITDSGTTVYDASTDTLGDGTVHLDIDNLLSNADLNGNNLDNSGTTIVDGSTDTVGDGTTDANHNSVSGSVNLSGDITDNGTTVYNTSTKTIGDGTTDADHSSASINDLSGVAHADEIGTTSQKTLTASSDGTWDTVTTDTISVSFNKTYNNPPDVIAIQNDGNFSGIRVAVTDSNITTSGVDITAQNYRSVDRDVAVKYFVFSDE